MISSYIPTNCQMKIKLFTPSHSLFLPLNNWISDTLSEHLCACLGLKMEHKIVVKKWNSNKKFII